MAKNNNTATTAPTAIAAVANTSNNTTEQTATFGNSAKNINTATATAEPVNTTGGKVMNKKYELVKSDSIVLEGRTLYRIKALRAISEGIPSGILGGYIESEKNLSQDGDCFVCDTSRVYGNATVSENAIVRCSSEVADNAVISGNAIIDHSVVYDSSVVDGGAFAHNSIIQESAIITDASSVYDSSVRGHSMICDHAAIYRCKVSDDSTVGGNSNLTKCRVEDTVCVKDREFDDLTIDKSMADGYFTFKGLTLDNSRVRPGILANK